jgi:hypothetical protein
MTDAIADRGDAGGLRIGPPSRRFTLSDAMALIAATAVGLGVTRPYVEFQWVRVAIDGEHWISRVAKTVETMVPPTLATLTLADLVLRFRRPRPRLRRIFRQPGAVAAVAALAGIILGTLMVFNVATVLGWSEVNLPVGAGASLAWFGVAWAWLTLAVTRRWRPDRSWPDRAGRALGACWVALLLVSAFSLPWKFMPPPGLIPPTIPPALLPPLPEDAAPPPLPAEDGSSPGAKPGSS